MKELLRPRLDWAVVFVPLSIVADFVWHSPQLTFVFAAIAILPLAGFIGRSTEQLALHVGPRMGGLLNASFGNLAELIIAIVLVLRNEFEVVKASLTGSILGNMLLVLGLAFLLGGIRHKEQRFNEHAAGVHSTSLLLATLGLILPALFVLTVGEASFVQLEVMSAVVAGVLILLYVAALAFMMVTHEHLFRTPEEHEEPEWPLWRALTLLVVAAGMVVFESELLVSALEPAVESLGVSKFFVGLIIVPVVGNAAEHGTAVVFAMKNKNDIALEIAFGSSTQIALFVAPAIVFLSLALGHPMDFVFTPFEVAAVGASVAIVSRLVQDGRSNWLEGAQLVAAYAIVAISFFFVS